MLHAAVSVPRQHTLLAKNRSIAAAESRLISLTSAITVHTASKWCNNNVCTLRVIMHALAHALPMTGQFPGIHPPFREDQCTKMHPRFMFTKL